jgi:hypothetical protein
MPRDWSVLTPACSRRPHAGGAETESWATLMQQRSHHDCRFVTMGQAVATFVWGLLIALAVTSCSGQGSHGGHAREFDPEALREKPWQSWNPAEISWGLRHYDEIFESRAVPAGTRTRPLEAGPSIARLVAGTRGGAELEEYLEDQRVAGLLVLQDGRIRLEQYGLGHSRLDRWTSQSVAKSVTSTLVGIALREGFIRSLDDPVSG